MENLGYWPKEEEGEREKSDFCGLTGGWNSPRRREYITRAGFTGDAGARGNGTNYCEHDDGARAGSSGLARGAYQDQYDKSSWKRGSCGEIYRRSFAERGNYRRNSAAGTGTQRRGRAAAEFGNCRSIAGAAAFGPYGRGWRGQIEMDGGSLWRRDERWLLVRPRRGGRQRDAC